MDCLPEPNRVANVEKWLSVEVRLCAKHLTKCQLSVEFSAIY